jgi:hypothetical protein
VMLRSGLPFARRANGSIRPLSPQALLIVAIITAALVIFYMSPSGHSHSSHDEDHHIAAPTAPKRQTPRITVTDPNSVYSLAVKNIDDQEVHLSKYKGKVRGGSSTVWCSSLPGQIS